MALNKGLLGKRLTDKQYETLKNTIDFWCVDKAMLYIENAVPSSVFLVKPYANPPADNRPGEYWSLGYVGQNDGVWAPNRLFDGGGNVVYSTNAQWHTYLQDGQGNSKRDIVLYSANPYITVSSFDTLNLGKNPLKKTTGKKKQLKDYFEDFNFFAYLAGNIPDFDLWDTETGRYMDYMYIGKQSGEKLAGNLVQKWQGNIHDLAFMVYSKYRHNWEQAKKYLSADYDLYDDVEHEERIIGENTTQTPNNWKTTLTGTAADNYTETENEIYGYNSAAASDDSKQTTKQNTNTVSEQTGTYENDRQYTETVDRRGSSKLRTGGEMLEIDNRFWNNWNFFNLIFKDVDKELTLKIYDFESCENDL